MVITVDKFVVAYCHLFTHYQVPLGPYGPLRYYPHPLTLVV